MEAGSCSARGAAQLAESNGTDPPPDPETFARSYQLEALEKAKKENTIVFLETGSGKTLIAVMLLRSYAFAIRKPSRHIAVFLVPTVVLVTQQAKVIEMHTALKVGKFWGEMGVDFWDADTWKENLEMFEVFVMTPQILLDNLRHTFFKLSDIKLIIFDECHHARGRHPYACIMMEFYHRHLESLSCELPRIFGMTASLVYSNGSNSHVVYRRQIQELENLMKSKVYTVESESILSAYISFPTPKIKQYEHIDSAHQQFIPVVERLKILKAKHIGAIIDKQDSVTKTSMAKKISKLHATFVYCLKELGAWLALKAAKSLTCSQNYLFFWGQNVDEAGENAIKAFIQEVFQVLSSYLPQEIYIGDDLKENVDSGLLSSKVECLVKSLLEYRDLQELRCIIFVERIITAIVIHSLLGDIKGFSGRTEYMAGSKKLLHSQSRKEQTKIVDSFHDGKVNVIVATQILEEGLDVHGCNLVIRFDPAASSCSFIQSRGRARMKGSDYVILIRRGDTATMSKVVNFLESGDVMREESRKQASIPCKSLQTNMFLDEIYCVESTGAIVTMNSSVALIHFYCSRLPSDEYFRPHPRFEFEKDSDKCTLCLPKSSPIQVVHAECSSSMLKQLLCLEACKKLHAVGALNDYLLPASDVEIEDTQLSEVEPYNKEQADYFPSDFVDSWSSFCCLGLYHCYKITIDQHYNYDFAFNDMMLIVKTDLGSNFLSYSFGLKNSRGPVSVQLNYYGIVHLSREQVMMAKSFQISIFNILLHCDYSKLMDSLHKNQISTAIAYLLVPLVGGRVDWQCVKSSFFHMGIVKDTAHSCVSKGSYSLVQTMSGHTCSCMLQHCIVYTPHSGKFYCVNGFLSDLNINSTFMLKDGRVLSYKEYFQSRHDVVLTCENQPLLSGRHLFKAENYLQKRSFRTEKVNSDAAVELPPELCTIIMSPISANTVYTFSFAPSIMHRIQCLLLASRLKKNILTDSMQNIDVPLSEVLEAITTDKCQEEFSLESLETLGDSFLKYAVNQNLFRAYKHHHEGILSAKKDKLVSNVALCRFGCDRHFPGFIRNRQFDPQEWFIPGSCADHFEETTLFPDSGCAYTSRTRIIKGKVIADTVEALIGVFLTAAGEKAALKFIEWLGIKMEFHQETAPERKDLLKYEMYINTKDLQSVLNYSFRNPTLLLEALTHASYQIPDVPGCYQRLEFLGDAVLDFLMTWYLYNKYPGLSPQMLTDLRSANVSNDCYARAAIRAGLNKHILHASPELHKRTTCYLEFCANNLAASSDVSDAGADPPKVLGDVIESIAGAIFVDSGYNKEVVWDSMKPLLEPMVSPETVEPNPVNELQHFCSTKHYQLTYKMTIQNRTINMTAEVKTEGATHTATITAPNKKTAQRMAAKTLLRDLKSRAASEL
ncbi:endoribonuclease Dicer homolog 2a-like [Zingiber officinale]|uniref:endoribonuclease Dicer homolog 2a-like n=1 Tax=Zingiber officinale TaxID=94328 RepID=UPI001C4C5338|nr:endoribonuclease Dicer homolog 2a-like [Zingiber officinale]